MRMGMRTTRRTVAAALAATRATIDRRLAAKTATPTAAAPPSMVQSPTVRAVAMLWDEYGTATDQR